jgi:hypothetical protein
VFQYGFWKSRNQYSPAPGILRFERELGGVVLLRPGRVVLPGRDRDLLGGDVDRPPQHDPLARTFDQQQAEPVGVVRRGEQRNLLEPAMKDCGSLTRARMSTTPPRRDLSSRFPAGGSCATPVTRRPQVGVAGV